MAREHDEFFWISAINKATVAVEGRNGLFDEALLRLAAKGIDAVEKAGDQDPAKRPTSYIAYEPLLIAANESGSYGDPRRPLEPGHSFHHTHGDHARPRNDLRRSL